MIARPPQNRVIPKFGASSARDLSLVGFQGPEFGTNTGRQGTFDPDDPEQSRQADERLGQLESTYGESLRPGYTGPTGYADAKSYSTHLNAVTEAQNIRRTFNGRAPLHVKYDGSSRSSMPFPRQRRSNMHDGPMSQTEADMTPGSLRIGSSADLYGAPSAIRGRDFYAERDAALSGFDAQTAENREAALPFEQQERPRVEHERALRRSQLQYLLPAEINAESRLGVADITGRSRTEATGIAGKARTDAAHTTGNAAMNAANTAANQRLQTGKEATSAARSGAAMRAWGQAIGIDTNQLKGAELDRFNRVMQMLQAQMGLEEYEEEDEDY